jgi:hypothetical protein
LAFVVFHLGFVPITEASGLAREVRTRNTFFALNRPNLVVDGPSFQSVFGDAFRRRGSAQSGPTPVSADLSGPEFGAVLSPNWPAEAGALAPTRFDAGPVVQAPSGFCRTRQCKTLVVIGAAVVAGGVALIAAGGEGNRQLGTAVALGGAGFIVLVLILDRAD